MYVLILNDSLYSLVAWGMDASAIAHDLGLGRGDPARMLLVSRLTIVVLVALSVLVAIYLPEKIFSRVLFAWIALGSAFGPLVYAR